MSSQKLNFKTKRKKIHNHRLNLKQQIKTKKSFKKWVLNLSDRLPCAAAPLSDERAAAAVSVMMTWREGAARSAVERSSNGSNGLPHLSKP